MVLGVNTPVNLRGLHVARESDAPSIDVCLEATSQLHFVFPGARDGKLKADAAAIQFLYKRWHVEHSFVQLIQPADKQDPERALPVTRWTACRVRKLHSVDDRLHTIRLKCLPLKQELLL
jgi:hypothetical protein